MTESHLDFYRRWHHQAKRYFEWQFSQFGGYLGVRVIDVGCGLGNFTDFLLDRNLYVGLDSDTALLDDLRYLYGGNTNVELIHGDITHPECRDMLKEKELESVLCINVLEHIENDSLAIGNMIDILVTGGTLCLLVPAMPSIYGTLDTLDGHFRRYTIKTLHDTLKKFPVKIIDMHYFNIVGALGWFIKGRILKQKYQKNENYLIMSSLTPFLSRIESYFRPPFGLSLIAVAKRMKTNENLSN